MQTDNTVYTGTIYGHACFHTNASIQIGFPIRLAAALMRSVMHQVCTETGHLTDASTALLELCCSVSG